MRMKSLILLMCLLKIDKCFIGMNRNWLFKSIFSCKEEKKKITPIYGWYPLRPQIKRALTVLYLGNGAKCSFNLVHFVAVTENNIYYKFAYFDL